MSHIFEALRAARTAREKSPERSLAASIPHIIPELAIAPTGPLLDRPTKTTRTIADSRSGAAALAAAQNSQTPAPARAERRTCKRVKLTLRAGVRRADLLKGQAPEIVATENSSRGGLCFLSTGKHYYKGMPVLVAFPYAAHHDGISGSEQLAHVLRVDPLPESKWRIAIGFGPPAAPTAGNKRQGNAERRQSRRTELSATVCYQEGRGEMSVKARCSELSVGGCYVDTLNPLAVGARIRLQIERDNRTFECFACVCSSHTGSGMGLSFEDPAADQVSTLVEWLCPTWTG